jgi:DNA-binding transcriptional LysR family regulator
MDRSDPRINLNLFRVFDAIYTRGGITAAARALHLTQPAISHSLHRLRELFGDPLFLRQGNRMVPTHRARLVIADVQLHLNGLQATTQMQAAFLPAALDLKFTVGFRDVLESIAFPPLMATLDEVAPNVRIVSRRIAASDVDRELAAGGIDLVIDRRLHAGPHLSSEDLFDESLVVVMRKTHPLASGTLRRSLPGSCRNRSSAHDAELVRRESFAPAPNRDAPLADQAQTDTDSGLLASVEGH